MDPTVVVSFVFAVVLAIIAGLSYYYSSYCPSSRKELYRKTAALFGIIALIFFVIAIFLLCLAPFCVVPLLGMIGISFLLFSY